MSSRFAAYS